MFMMLSCSNTENEYQPNNKENDVNINAITVSKNENHTLYGTKTDNTNFDYSTKNTIKGSFSLPTKSSMENKEFIFFKDKNEENKVIAFYLHKTHGVQKSAIFKYKIELS